MRPLVVVVVGPWLEAGIALVGVGPVFCIGPLAQGGLDEALGLAVGSGRVGPGAARWLSCICWQAWRNWLER